MATTERGGGARRRGAGSTSKPAGGGGGGGGNGGNGPIKYRCSFNNSTIRGAIQSRGWKEGEHDGDWDLYWGDREWVYEIFDTMHLDSNQRLNHFRNSKELCRKDLLVKNLKKRKRQLEREGQVKEAGDYDFFPVTFTLPREYAMFVEEFKRVGGIWIMKPIGSAQGKGIFLFTRLSEISEWKYDFRSRGAGAQDGATSGGGSNRDGGGKDVEAYIVQRYIANPYLIGGKKFDLRLYVLVTSFMPLTAYLYQDGFARFTQTRYSSEPGDVANTFMHLTNVAIQKKSEDYDDRTGGKMDLRSLKLLITTRLGAERVDTVFHEIEMVVIRSLQSVQPVMIQDKHCFEIYGYDIMIDHDLKPWLIEVNASPSLTANTKLDYDLKFRMLNEALDIVDMEEKLEGDEMVVGGFCQIISQGNVSQQKLYRPSYTTILGTKIHDGPPISRSKLPSPLIRSTSGREEGAESLSTSAIRARPQSTGRRARETSSGLQRQSSLD